MPSHIHMIVQHPDRKLAETLRDFKSFTAKEILKVINELGLVREAEDYAYSSAVDYAG